MLSNVTGPRLLDRTPQGTRLTKAGEVFLPLAKALLRTATQAAARTRFAKLAISSRSRLDRVLLGDPATDRPR